MATKSEAARDRKLKDLTDSLLVTDISYEESQKHYTNWAVSQDKNYDKLHSESTYTSPKRMADEAAKLFLRPEQKVVLDLGAGTGISGQMLRDNGFRTLHALEPCKEFLPQMESKNIYKKVFNTCIGRGAIVDAPERSYDLIVASGSFGPGCIPCDALYEIIRLLKPGGYFVNGIRKEYFRTVPEYRDRLEPLMRLLERDGRWRQVKWDTYPRHFFDKDGILLVFQRC